jgi:GxxExxY protein
MPENAIAKTIIDLSYKVHTELGPGLFESVYELILAHEIENQCLKVERQKIIPIRYGNKVFDHGFVADLVVEDLVIVELKSVEKIAPVHMKQLLTYLRLSNKRLGLLINFGGACLKGNISRVANNL